jgi:hypothetical protein
MRKYMRCPLVEHHYPIPSEFPHIQGKFSFLFNSAFSEKIFKELEIIVLQICIKNYFLKNKNNLV